MTFDRAASIERFERSCVEIEKIIALAKKHKAALDIKYQLDLAGEKDGTYSVSREDFRELVAAGFQTIYGLRLIIRD